MVTAADLPHVRPLKPLHFPVTYPEWTVAQTFTHRRLASLVYTILSQNVPKEHLVGSDQFIYFDAGDPTRRCDPDAYVKLGVPDHDIDNWKTWEKNRGTPDLCVEIFSHEDGPEHEPVTWDEKLRTYLALGVPELVRFDVDAPAGERLRAWDYIDGDLIERVVKDETTPCLALDLHWVVVPSLGTTGEELPAALRLARDAQSQDLVLTGTEAAKARLLAANAKIERLRAEEEARSSR